MRAALVLTLLSGPAMADDWSDQDAYFEALLNCLTVGAKLSMMDDTAGANWRREGPDDAGVYSFHSTRNANTLIRMEDQKLTDDPHFCEVSSQTIPTDAARLLLSDMITTNGFPYQTGAKDELGCDAYANEFGWTVAVNAGGENATCDDPAKSAIRVIRRYN